MIARGELLCSFVNKIKWLNENRNSRGAHANQAIEKATMTSENSLSGLPLAPKNLDARRRMRRWVATASF
jgi:hypothetical protein